MALLAGRKALLEPLNAALYEGQAAAVERELGQLFAPHARIRLGEPFGELVGPEALWSQVYAPLFACMPDLERRDFIRMEGPRWLPNLAPEQAGYWIGLGGNWVGTLRHPWLGIPAGPRPLYMRYHEYLRIEGEQVVEMEGVWDIPQLMHQAGAWPLPAQLGAEWMCPGPADGSGLGQAPRDPVRSEAALRSVWNMLHDLRQGNAENPGRSLDSFWHPHALWYGSTGLGTARGEAGIRDLILSGFRTGLSDNQRHLEQGVFFAEGDLVAFTGWPSGTATHSGDGFLGLPPTGKRFERRSLDFWRLEQGRVRENWVLVDLIHVYAQLGLDVFARLRKLTGQEACV